MNPITVLSTEAVELIQGMASDPEIYTNPLIAAVAERIAYVHEIKAYNGAVVDANEATCVSLTINERIAIADGCTKLVKTFANDLPFQQTPDESGVAHSLGWIELGCQVYNLMNVS